MGKNVKQTGSVWGIFPKLNLLFLLLSVSTLIVFGYMANKNMAQTSLDSTATAMRMGEENFRAAKDIGQLAIEGDAGTTAKDAFLTITQTAKKLGVNAFNYITDRVSGKFSMPALSELLIENAMPRTG
jgi:hypothetical protein